MKRRYFEMPDTFGPALLVAIAGFAIVPVTGCTSSRSWNGKVQQHGDMHLVLGQQQHHGRVSLAAATHQPHCYAIGALEGLAGEVTIVDGTATVTRVAGEDHTTVVSSTDPDQQAALLVSAYVPEWREHRLEHDVTYTEFEKFIHDAGTRAGLDPTKPYPFLIEGNLAELKIHVISGACPMRAERLGKPLPPERQPYQAGFKQTEGLLVGFYGEDASCGISPHGTKTHVHVLLSSKGNEKCTGHVEQVCVKAGSVLRLPVPVSHENVLASRTHSR